MRLAKRSGHRTDELPPVRNDTRHGATSAMPYRLNHLFDNGNAALSRAPAPISEAELVDRIDRLLMVDRPRYRRLWDYQRNPLRVIGAVSDEAGTDRPYRQAQEWGLPSRITGRRNGALSAGSGDTTAQQPVDGVIRKEVVIENDIGWRIETMVDFLFGKPLVIASTAANPDRRELISRLLRLVLAHNGGILFLQQLALLGAVYGFVDVLVKLTDDDSPKPPPADDELSPVSTGIAGAGAATMLDESPTPTPADGTPASAGPAPTGDDHTRPSLDDTPGDAGASASHASHGIDASLARLARRVRLEIVEPARALPLLSITDYRDVLAYGQVYEVPVAAAGNPGGRVAASGWLRRLRQRSAALLGHDKDAAAAVAGHAGRRAAVVVELIGPHAWQRYEDEALVARGVNSLGRVPLVHVQNTAVPFQYAGASDVEPLLPLQDELNTRLSDRANRITMQSFKMYLGKGIEQFLEMPVAPGRMWASENESADIIEFGGDANCPSEEAHITDLREAMDKTSGVTPIAAGAIKGRIGRLTSAAALRVTMQALLAKTEKKRTTYGLAIAQMCELALAWLDRAGLFPTNPDERQIELHWPSPLPENSLERLQEAEAKARLGIPREVVLRELGY